MSSCEITQHSENSYKVAGILDFDTVPNVLKQSVGLIDKGENIKINLAQVSKSNSAGLALLIEWKAIAHSNGYEVEFTNIPQQIVRLVEVCKIEKLIGVD